MSLVPYWLSGRRTDRITAYLFHAGGDEDPVKLQENVNKSFIGSYVLGMGFTFDDTDKDGVASPISEMERLIRENPVNSERIFPYLGGEEVNSSPTHSHHRYVINFEDFPLCRKETGNSWFLLKEQAQREQLREGVVAADYPHPVAADWPSLLRIIEEHVRPERMKDNRANYRRLWWQFAERRPGLSHALRQINRAWCIARVNPWHSITAIDSMTVPAETIVIITQERLATFTCLQSRAHELWARFMASSMKDDLRYGPSDCFETFPFPLRHEHDPILDSVGQGYFEFRAGLMVRSGEGLTKTYNRFHRPDENSPDILKLRELHDAMDRAVLDSYGWQDLRPKCDFFPEFDDEDDDDSESRPNATKEVSLPMAGRNPRRGPGATLGTQPRACGSA